MLRRYILDASSRRTFPRVTTQIPAFLSSRKALSTAPQENAPLKPGSTGKPPESGSSLSKFVVATLFGGAAVAAANQFGYLDQFLSKDRLGFPNEAKVSVIVDAKDFPHMVEKVVSSSSEEPSRVSPNAENAEQKVEKVVSSSSEEPSRVSPNVENAEQKVEIHSDATLPEPSSEREAPSVSQVQDKSDVIVTQEEGTVPVEKKGVQDKSSVTSQGGLNLESSDAAQPVSAQAGSVPEDHGIKSLPPQHVVTEDKPKNASIEDTEPSTSLLDAYYLKDKEDESVTAEHLVQEKEAVVSATEENAGYISKDGKLVLDFLQAIHTAEKRQAEIDARVLAEERKALKEKYEKELKDAIAREFMRAEEAAILDKELKREKAKAAAAIKSLQEKAEERLKMELEKKENESEMKLKKVEELAKAELAAKIASEKAAQIEKIAEANLNINALCMAFYARSEEARQSHSAHKLALGALALDDALSKGLPIQAEIEALHTYLEGNEKEPILDLVLASLPEETKSHGTDTVLQLNQKFDALKETLRHFSLLPPGGGGILAHSLARIASWLKVKEADQSGDGIESVINRVESYLAEGKLVEAANALEEGVQGSQAEEVVSVWVAQARNRAIAEQALTLLQSYATSISLS